MVSFEDRKSCRLMSSNDGATMQYEGSGDLFKIMNSEAVERHQKDSTKLWKSNESISSCLTHVSEVEVQTEHATIVPSAETKTSNLIIFDYDDTILPTYSLTVMQRQKLGVKLSDEVLQELNKLSDAVLENLQTALNVGTIVIVTNASSEWLSQSCEKYLPRVGAFLIENKIRIISARDRFGNSLLAQKHWKYFIFIDLIEEQFIRQLKSGEPFSVISIGDGSEEREACMKLIGIFKNQAWTFKNLKFLNQPSYGCLTLQHVLLQKSFQNFLDMDSSADLCIQFDKVG
ncbi:conserved hypothetical protein [Theileria equi strain WA]|uniref:Uncharacterized protein n=1 Tax=Theileria equi strain WA TaxID=1537102 RepID=L1LBT5_THEEQ|nr:conserved hypothetical protein [Theileria equi strain WA]EKX72734.1 conserved hypothetical protein [Theileria equi strain WA]|eukprot:XP_004832186.1 conserved hypothetical protein [Theileria equi strain WA]